jgi:hypothetical protein
MLAPVPSAWVLKDKSEATSKIVKKTSQVRKTLLLAA